MSKPVLLTPLRAEAAAARIGARGRLERVELVGMGPAKATSAAERLGRVLAPSVPIGVLGFAGGLAVSDRAGDLVVATELFTTDESIPRRELDGGLASRVLRALSQVLDRVRSGPLACSPSLVRQGAPAINTSAPGEPAIACEMESAWLGSLSEGRPFVVVRAIVDRPGRPMLGPWTLWGGAKAWRRLAIAAGVVADQLALYH